MQSSSLDPEDEPEELARFRAAWKAELESRRKRTQPTPQRPDEPSPKPDGTTPHLRRQAHHPTAHAVASASSEFIPVADHIPTKLQVDALSPKLTSAVEIYRRAMMCEERSDLDQALQLYRTAFRMDSNVDRAYRSVELRLQSDVAAAASSAGIRRARHNSASSDATVVNSITTTTDASATSNATVVEEITKKMKNIHVAALESVTSSGQEGSWINLLTNWPYPLTFEQENEKEPIYINSLPEEIVIHILRLLDVTSVERFAAVSRKARILTLDPVIWRDFVHGIYKFPEIAEDMSISDLLERYSEDYRRVYIEHPRIRLDGVYIAVCHYIRAGLSENAWTNISHLITYHRYLRFFPNGEVITLLAGEEMSHPQVIPQLKPSIHMKGALVGTWYLDGTTVHLNGLIDPTGKMTRYAFQMRLELQSRPLGRWNRLNFRAYDSVDVGTGEARPLGLKHERPFWFSKVRSYAV